MWTLCPHFVHIPAKANIMNRRKGLLDSASFLIAKGDDSHPPMATACYLGAIAKLLLAQALGDAPASRQAFYQRDLCTVCARPRVECTCGSPYDEDDVSPLRGV